MLRTGRLLFLCVLRVCLPDALTLHSSSASGPGLGDCSVGNTAVSR